jgi:hypothetical protein
MPFILSTAKGSFHQYLAQLGKTPLSDSKELTLLDRARLNDVKKMPNPVFFLEISQLGDANVTRSEIL